MRKIIVRDRHKIFPFNEPARKLRVLNKPLWLHQADVLYPYTEEEHEVNSLREVDTLPAETLVYRDNLFFDKFFVADFIRRARAMGGACQVAFSPNDHAITEHAIYLQKGIRLRSQGDVYVADLWYYPSGKPADESSVQPLVIDTESHEMGYYHVPTHMATSKGDLVYQVPTKAFCSIEHWVHTITANVIFGALANGARMDRKIEQSVGTQLKMLWRSLLEQKQLHASSAMVEVGDNCSIDPTAIVKGPTRIGNNVSIGAGAVVDVSVIGDNVDIMQGAQVQWSVISDRCYLPFRAAIFASVMMEDSMLAQNTCVQFCSIGCNTFIGAGTTFTDFNLVPKPIRAERGGQLGDTGMPVLGGCVGHNCYIGSGLVVLPARAIESDVVLFASPSRRVIDRTVRFEDSDHLLITGGPELHGREYES